MTNDRIIKYLKSIDCIESFETPKNWCPNDYTILESKILSFVRELETQLNIIASFKGNKFHQDSSFCASVTFPLDPGEFIVFRFSHFGSLVYLFLGDDLLSGELKEKVISLLLHNDFVYTPKALLSTNYSISDTSITWEERFFGYS